jgi:hypothetical protein
MKRFTALGVALLFTSLSAYPNFASQKTESPPDMCPMHASPNAKVEVVMAHSNHAAHQDPAQPQDPDDSQEQQPAPPHQPSEGVGCSRPHPSDPNGNKGTEANTIACHCVRKTPCNNGEPGEDPGSPDDKYKTRCKNWCFKSRCSCPNPCKS